MNRIQRGIILKLGDKFISQTLRRGYFDCDHLVVNLVDDITNATVYEEVPTDFKGYRGMDLKTLFEKAEQLQVIVTVTRNVTLKVNVEIL